MSRLNVQLCSFLVWALALLPVAAVAAENSLPPMQLITGLEMIGDQTLPSLEGDEPVQLIFLDARCPNLHFPTCESVLEQLREEYGEGDRWLAIINSFYIDTNAIRGFIQENQLALPVLFDGERRLYERFHVYATPYLITLNRNGEVLYRGEDFSQLQTKGVQDAH